jgi:hypothetical protein
MSHAKRKKTPSFAYIVVVFVKLEATHVKCMFFIYERKQNNYNETIYLLYNETPTGTTHTFETPRMQLHAYIYSSDDEKGHWAFRPKNVRIGGPQLTMRTRLNEVELGSR